MEQGYKQAFVQVASMRSYPCENRCENGEIVENEAFPVGHDIQKSEYYIA